MPALIQTITQKDNHTFTIHWSNGKIMDFRLSELQKNCPCANCIDESTGQRMIDEKAIKNDVRAIKIFSVGRYAIRIQYTSGCSTGIYSFDMLQNMNPTGSDV